MEAISYCVICQKAANPSQELFHAKIAMGVCGRNKSVYLFTSILCICYTSIFDITFYKIIIYNLVTVLLLSPLLISQAH